MLSPTQVARPNTPSIPVSRQPQAPVAPARPTMAADSLSLSKPQATIMRPVKPSHNGGWDDLTNLVPVLVFSPLASVLAAGVGFLAAGPLGAAIGAAAGGAAPGTLLGTKQLIHHVEHRAKHEDTDDNFNLKLAGKLFITPGTTLAGAGLGFMVGGPIGAAVGAAIGATGMLLVGAVASLFKKRPPAEVVETPPANG